MLLSWEQAGGQMPYLWRGFIDDLFFLPPLSHLCQHSLLLGLQAQEDRRCQLTWRRLNLKTELVTRSLDAAFDKFRLLSRSENLVMVPHPHEGTGQVTKDTSKE